MKVIFVPDTRVNLINLTSYTPYLVTLTAFNAAGDGPPSEPRGARTQQSGPALSKNKYFRLHVLHLLQLFPPSVFSSQPAQLPVLLRGDRSKCQCVVGSPTHPQRTAGGIQGHLSAHSPHTRYVPTCTG